MTSSDFARIDNVLVMISLGSLQGMYMLPANSPRPKSTTFMLDPRLD